MSEGKHPTLPIDASLLRTLLDGTFEGIFIHDDVIHYANASAARITGRPVDELIGLRMAALQPEDACCPPTPIPVQGAWYGPVEFEACGGPDAASKTIEVQGRAVELHGRHLWLSAFRDITPHRAAQARLLNRLEFEDLITSISADFIHLEPSEVPTAIDHALGRIGQFAHVDRSYVYMIEGDMMRASNVWTEEIGHRARDRFADWTTPIGDFAWAIEKLRADEAVVYEVKESYWFDASGQKQRLAVPRPRSSCCVPMIVKGTLLGYIGFDAIGGRAPWDEDTTRLLRTVGYILAQLLHRKQAQEDLANAYATMEAEVERRREELERQHLQLLHAEKMASLGALVAGVAHEINTPLGAIKSNTDTLVRSLSRIRDTLEKPELAALTSQEKRLPLLMDSSLQVNQINVQAIDRITAIVNSLRKFARLDQAEIDTIDLHEAIDNTLTLVRHELKHRVEVFREYGDLPPVECFPDQLNQVFMNLLVNAGQAIEGRGEIRITTRRRADGTVSVDFRDNGRGIDEAQLKRVFDPGFTTKGVGVGTGLGLSIVQRIVDAHHGRIEVESDVGVGSTFRIVIPARQPSPRATQDAPGVAAKPT